MNHSKLSPSTSHRWLACPASVKMEEGYPDSTSVFAVEGTNAHKLAESKLLQLAESKLLQLDFFDFFDFPIDSEMMENVNKYVDFVDSLKISGNHIFIEKKVDFSNFVKGGFGTCDCIIYDSSSFTLKVSVKKTL